MNEHRLLITGSREWTDVAAIRDALADYWRSVQPSTVTLVSGRCPKGVDALAEQEWAGRGLPVEIHPADWDNNGRSAGFRRNALMVALGADFCLAFIAPCVKQNCRTRGPHGSHGATGCAKLATDAGIPTKVVLATTTPPLRPAQDVTATLLTDLPTQNGPTAP